MPAAVTNTFTSGTTIVAAQMNTNFTDVLNSINGVSAGNVASAALAASSVTASKLGLAIPFATMNVGPTLQAASAQGVMGPAGTGTTVTVASNNSSYLTATAATSRFTAISAGLFAIGGIATFSQQAAASTSVTPQLYKNGTLMTVPSYDLYTFPTAVNGNNMSFTYFALLPAAANDYFQFGHQAVSSGVIGRVYGGFFAYLGLLT